MPATLAGPPWAGPDQLANPAGAANGPEPKAPATPPLRQNATIARRLEEVAALLEEQGANPFRVRAYRSAAATVRAAPRSVAEIVWSEGAEGLEKLPGIGPSLARAIRDQVRLGRLPMLDRLRGASDPEKLLASVPGIGPVLAERLHHELGIGTLEDLEAAAHEGRLAGVEGIGPQRLAGIIDSLAGRLGRVRPLAPPEPPPPVEEILDVDREYRTRASQSELPTITPRRFNPDRKAWLPVLHTQRGPHHYTALFSNTARAHELRRTHDWVVLYYDGGRGEHQCTVVTERRGPLANKRVVRGREAECLGYYRGEERKEP
jgi:predicted flap endonuclease-1-like 5' DNA nuclease